MPEYAVAVDVGGTFTDVTVVELQSGRLWSIKTPTTPQDPSAGFSTGVQEALRQARIGARELSRVFQRYDHCANAILEQKGVKTGLITTLRGEGRPCGSRWLSHHQRGQARRAARGVTVRRHGHAPG